MEKEKDLIKVLKKLKNGKARDPLGWCNEIFKLDTAGVDLRKSILMLFNKIKECQEIPDFMQLGDLTRLGYISKF